MERYDLPHNRFFDITYLTTYIITTLLDQHENKTRPEFLEALSSITSTQQLPLTPAPKDLMPSSDLLGQQAHTWFSHLHVGKTPIHKREEQILKVYR